MDSKEINDKRSVYRRVFNTPEGRVVLTDILNELSYFSSHIESAEDTALNNAARRLLYNIGAWRDENIYLITDALLALPWEDKDISEEDTK